MKEYIVRCENNEFTIEREIVRCKECRNRHRQHRCAGRHPNWFCGDGVKDEITIQTGQTYGKSANFADDVLEQIEKQVERIKEDTEKNPDSLWSKGMKSFDGLDQVMENREKHQLSGETPTNTPTNTSTNTSTDLISRLAVLDALAEEEYRDVEDYRTAVRAIGSIPINQTHDKRTETHGVCSDCISKHDLWRIIEDNAYWVTYNETSREKGMTLTGINQALNECPPVEPERSTGEWIQNAPEGQGIDPPYICSMCL